MKRIFILFLIVTSLNVNGQYIRTISDSIYSTLRPDPVVGKLTKSDGIHLLYESIRGRIYYWKISKNGNRYKAYPRHPFYKY